MPAATTQQIIFQPGPAPAGIIAAILARLAVLSQNDPQLAALLAQYQTATGQPLG